MNKEDRKEYQRRLMKERYRQFQDVQEIIDKDTVGCGPKFLEAPGDNDYVGRLFNHPSLWF